MRSEVLLFILGVDKVCSLDVSLPSANVRNSSQLFATVRNEIDAAAPIARVLADLASHFVWQASAGVALSDTQMYVVTLSKLVLCDSHNIFEWLFLDSKMAFSFCGRRST
jgi:hypothetical protein